MKNVLSLAARSLLLVVAYIVLLMIASRLTTPAELAARMTPEQVAQAAAALPLVAALMTGTLVYLALRSRWHGWKLAGGLFVVFFGVYTFLAQIEPLAFPAVTDRMPPGTIPMFFVAGLMLTAPFSLLTVWVLGRARPAAAPDAANDRLNMPAAEWAWKLAAAVLLYEIVYFTFGYYVAWRTPGLPEFYGGTDPGTFFGQLGNVWRETPWLFLFQVFRALVWTGIACVIVAMHRGGAVETAFATGLAFSMFMSATMLIPSPIMPPDVYRAHFIELTPSNFLFGVLAAGLLMWRPARRAVG
jgi:hypothetical protein